MEWTAQKRWNPFNSAKLLAHVNHWSNIKPGHPVPPPVTVTIDPTNICNLGCQWCNSRRAQELNRAELSESVLEPLAEFLEDWGVEAVCIAGGGEPSMYECLNPLITLLVQHHLKVGVVTNGTNIDRYVDGLRDCVWVGVSVDAGTEETYRRCKGLNTSFASVSENMRELVRFSEGQTLGKLNLGNGVFYKFLIHPLNIQDICAAAQHAKRIGCKGIHYRPAGRSWFDEPDARWPNYTPMELSQINSALYAALALDDENFSVYGVTHKFNDNFQKCNEFGQCNAVFMTCIIMPASDGGAGLDLGLCCDRRGDERMLMGRNIYPDEIGRRWGSKKHWQLSAAIDVKRDCPRCTYQPHNQIYEQVICQDSMTHIFI